MKDISRRGTKQNEKMRNELKANKNKTDEIKYEKMKKGE
jgi:hypothetical protein